MKDADRNLKHSPIEAMVIEASKYIRDGEVVIVGTGLPLMACMFAQRTHAPSATYIVETGAIGPYFLPTPLSVADPRLTFNAMKLGSLLDILCLLQRGLVDLGLLGGAQIDEYGNINSTVIGEYLRPKVRLPGSGGANDIASLVKRVIIMTVHEKRRFPRKVDYITSPGFIEGTEGRTLQDLPGLGPEAVITDLCVMGFDEETKRMRVEKLMLGASIVDVHENMMFKPLVADKLEYVKAPSREELILLRSLDSEGIYLKR